MVLNTIQDQIATRKGGPRSIDRLDAAANPDSVQAISARRFSFSRHKIHWIALHTTGSVSAEHNSEETEVCSAATEDRFSRSAVSALMAVTCG